MDVFLLSLLVLGSVGRGDCQTGSDAKSLRTKLMVTDAYDKNVLPLLDQSRTVDVHVSFYLHAINGLNEVTETLTTTGYLWVTWIDEFLVWDPADHNGISFYHWPQDDIWKPDVTLRNSIKEYKELGGSSLKIQVASDGRVNWYPFQVFQSTCSVDITYFPFDIQTCHLTFITWSYTRADVTEKAKGSEALRMCGFAYFNKKITKQVNIIGGSDGIDLDQYEESSLWEVIGSSWSSDEVAGEALIEFTLEMKRKPLYFLLSVIMPIVMLAVLNVFVFTLPCESGERAGYAITVFLALAVFLTIVAQSLPANSETIAIFAIYVIIQTFQSTVTTVLALLTIRLSTKETEVPTYLVRFTDYIHRLQCKRPIRNNSKVQPFVADTCTRRLSTREGPNNVPHGQSVNANRSINVDDGKAGNNNEDVGVTEDVSEPAEKVSWSTAVRAIDFVLFVFFVTTLSVSTLLCFIITGTST